MSFLNQEIRKDSSICDHNDQLLQLKMFDLRPEVGLFVSAHLKHQRGGATGFYVHPFADSILVFQVFPHNQ